MKPALLQRRTVLAAGMAGAASSLLPGCSPTGPDSSASTGAPTVLRFAWWGGASRHAATLKALALFEQRNPGLRVKAEYMGFNGYLERLTTQIAGRAEPDLMQINWAWLSTFSKTGESVATVTTGVCSLSSAIGPCFISPAA